MKIKSSIILLIGCVVIATANAASKAATPVVNSSSADKAARLKQFLNSTDDTSYSFDIVNNTDNNFADLFIQSDPGKKSSGEIIYQPKSGKSGGFSCAAHTTCQLAITWKKKPKGSWTFKFYGDDKTLTSAYILASPMSGSITITPQDMYLGYYSFSQIKSRYKGYEHLSDVGRKLTTITGTPLSGQNSHKAILDALALDLKNSKIANSRAAENKYFSKFQPQNAANSSK
jgi:hypothetical protein